MANNRVAQWWGHLPELAKAVIFAGAATITAAIVFSGFFTVVPAGGRYLCRQ
jgi:hypothetical protein